ncbi:hypothetical protein AB0B28_02355 [Glycomyces sp. NPDC046736]|uniref:hypothetical protein n=1 Tax=Glycomyces sp. NPDC046736 TaxID=3155615 RepID=UPI00340285D9
MTIDRRTIADLPAYLRARGFGSAHYSIGVGRRDSVSVVTDGDAWVVCPKFEGHMTGVGRFRDEHEACKHVLRLLQEEEHRAGPDGAKANGYLQEYFAREREPIEDRIRALGVGSAHFSVGKVRDGAWCLVDQDGRWLTFLMQHGRRTRVRDHRSDYAAAESAFVFQIKLWKRERLAARKRRQRLRSWSRTA